MVVEAILGISLANAKQDDSLPYVFVMVGILLVTFIMAFLIEFKRVSQKENIILPAKGNMESQNEKFDSDVFLAAAMAGIDNDEDFKLAMMKLRNYLQFLRSYVTLKNILRW